jgi:hypothetical protein
MKKQFLGHFLFWAILICIDVTSYIPVWKKIIGVSATVNYSWIIITFYASYLICTSLFTNERDQLKIWQRRQFWMLVAMPVIYITTSIVLDKYVLSIYNFPTIWTCSVAKFIMIYPFFSSAIFLAGFRTHVIQFRNIRRERNDLLIANNYLDEENTKFRTEKGMLLKELNLLKFEVVASREKVASLCREYDKKLETYRQMIDSLKRGDGYDSF